MLLVTTETTDAKKGNRPQCAVEKMYPYGRFQQKRGPSNHLKKEMSLLTQQAEKCVPNLRVTTDSQCQTLSPPYSLTSVDIFST